MKIDAQTKKKIEAKKKERKEILGENADLYDALMTDNITEEEKEKIQIIIDKNKIRIDFIEDDLEEYGDTSTNLLLEKKRMTAEQEKVVIENLIKQNYIGYLIEDNKFIYCLQMATDNNNGIVNPQFRVVEGGKIVNVLNKMGSCQLHADSHSVSRLFQITGNDYYGMTGSFNNEKWNEKLVYNKMKIIENFWVQPTEDTAYNIDFDFLMHCVGGGKDENIEHLEKWVAYKWMYPQRNANIPNIDLGGYPGGNGKGRFVELLKTIFTHGCVVPAALKELTDGFNATWETAVILYYDEPANNELPEGKLKNATGGEEQRIEKKGVDAYTADRNYNMIFTSNNPNGVIRLAGTGSSGEDRRWSVMTTNKVMVDELVSQGLDIEQAKVRTNEINNLLKNREEVSKWLSHLLIKHDVQNMQILYPLHGQDYEKRFEDQKDTVQLVFDGLIPVLAECGVLTLDVLVQAVHELTNNTKLTRQKIDSKFQRYLEQNRIKFEYLKNIRVNLLYQGSVAETVQKSCYQLPQSNTNYGLDYALFSTVVPGKKTKLTASDFTISV
tara:strand:- start:192 stop:1853 length:1662 start_codon:yes stop_codon:yes gene_type:complete